MLPKCLTLIFILCSCSDIQGKAINIMTNVKNRISEINSNIVIIIGNSTLAKRLVEPGNITGKAIKAMTNVKHKISKMSHNFMNNIGNSTLAKIPVTPDNITKFFPLWVWFVLGIMLASTLCFLCCCPYILVCILGPLFQRALGLVTFIINVILLVITLSVRCCLKLSVRLCISCLGFSQSGPKASSVAAAFQSWCYGGNTPSGSCFSAIQSFSMQLNYKPFRFEKLYS